MKFNKDSNVFTFIFTGLMVVLVGFVLSTVDFNLKDKKDKNKNEEKMQQIVQTISKDEVKRENSEEVFVKMIKKVVILNYNKEKIHEHVGESIINDKNSGFYVDVRKEYKSIKDEKARQYPLFISNNESDIYYIMPLAGSGLWGPIWGYIAVDSDLNVIGVIFDHKAETPGLGAEIRETDFQIQFNGKKILDKNDNYKSIKVIRGGADKNDLHGVDAITGGTITSDGVSEMLERTLQVYISYIKNEI